MKLTEEKLAIANSYKTFIQSKIWRDLEAMAAHQIDESMKGLDVRPAEELNINHVCDERGFRRGLRWFINQVHAKAEIG